VHCACVSSLQPEHEVASVQYAEIARRSVDCTSSLVIETVIAHSCVWPFSGVQLLSDG